ncbi:UDP-glucose,sterol transferase, putative [Cordyceps militaris CM01]|uniref:UDP-glucose,sterol transferase, putative n=1 Tax=Cordyceps militaris (strain CM01) TaxID=983644 RepID=G3JH16_CORMM|nr:UDP-glucose,sterol transferase, putative [Cordyceps militaris CM01]EGX91572.1 UDP-glucose,sterol transferase, putative [Cordyceps militaris CM01]
MFRTKSTEPGQLVLEQGPSGSVLDDGRFKIRFHSEAHSLASWYHDLQMKRSCKHPASRPTSPEALKTDPAGFPPLNIAIHIVGSRGDVQPFIPIAQILSAAPFNHRVRICTHPVFKDFVEEQGVEFFSIGGDPEALMSYMVRNPGLLPNRESVKAGDIGKRRDEMAEIINGCWRSCIEAGNGMGEPVTAAFVTDPKELFIADVIIANPPSMAHIHCAEKLGIPLHMVFTMPWSPTDAFAHPLAAMNYGGADKKMANYISFIMMELLTWQGLGDLISKFRHQKLGLDPISPLWGFHLLPRLRVPFTYLWSKSLIPKPKDWGNYINITGFSFLPLASSYTPPDDLTAFLAAGPAPIYIGFGSIVVKNPAELSKLLFAAVKKAGVRAIISKGWSKVGGDDVPDNIYLIGNCPHDWLFQHVSAVVHHGGAGTTAAGIAAGRPTVVVPFFGDQAFWGRMVARAGAGPEPVPFTEMTVDSLAKSITTALTDDVQKGAQEMAKTIAAENGAEDTVTDFLERLASEDKLQCDLCPGRLAIWLHKKTGARLSGFAAACLADKGIMTPDQAKLIHHKSWYVDEGAEHPLVGMVASATGFVTAVAIASSDYSKAWKYRPSKASAKKETASESSFERKGAVPEDKPPANGAAHIITPSQMEISAKKMATKSLRTVWTPQPRIERTPTFHDNCKAEWEGHEKGRHGRTWYLARKTSRFGVELTKAGLKAPVAFFWNTANGFHNFPSYGYAGIEVRRRDEVKGFGSGVKVAGKEFVLGFWDAFSGIIVLPYKGTRDEGAKGLGKGIWRGGKGFFCGLGAAVFGLPGYTLKGFERELSKRHLTKLKAEILLIRLRKSLQDFREATVEEREAVIDAWMAKY